MAEYEFGIASLVNKKELLQVGDPVQFQLHVGEDFAVNIQATREKLRSYVEAMKGEFMLMQHRILIFKFLEYILHYIFQNTQVTSNKMVQYKRHHFLAVFHTLSHGVIFFVSSVSSKNHLLTG